MKTLCITFGFLLCIPTAFAQLDLHAHLIMKPGLGPLLKGQFLDPPVAKNWESRTETKGTARSLIPPHAPKLIVISLYAHPWLSHFFHFNPLQNVRWGLEAEYQALTEFIKSHSDQFGIARNAKEARILLKEQKNVFVLSIEGAYGAFDKTEDYQKWIEERGVSIVTPFHLTEDHFGGTALMSNQVAFFNAPFTFLSSLLLTGGACFRDFCKSTLGIKGDGDLLIQELIKRKVWIDLSHANEMEVRELLPQLKSKQLPLLVTHTQIREVFPAERGIGNLEVNYLAKHGGIIGLIPTDDMMMKMPDSSFKPTCNQGVTLFKEVFQYTQKTLGELHVALASDINAPLTGLSPHCKSETGRVLSELEKNGFYTYSQWNELSDFVANDSTWNSRIIEAFLNEWEKVRPSN